MDKKRESPLVEEWTVIGQRQGVKKEHKARGSKMGDSKEAKGVEEGATRRKRHWYWVKSTGATQEHLKSVRKDKDDGVGKEGVG